MNDLWNNLCPPNSIYKNEFGMGKNGGERGIRTLDGLLTHTPLAGERFRPLSQLSVSYFKNIK